MTQMISVMEKNNGKSSAIFATSINENRNLSQSVRIEQPHFQFHEIILGSGCEVSGERSTAERMEREYPSSTKNLLYLRVARRIVDP